MKDNYNNCKLGNEDIAKYELIVYKGKKETKILKSSYFKIRKIKKKKELREDLILP